MYQEQGKVAVDELCSAQEKRVQQISAATIRECGGKKYRIGLRRIVGKKIFAVPVECRKRRSFHVNIAEYEIYALVVSLLVLETGDEGRLFWKQFHTCGLTLRRKGCMVYKNQPFVVVYNLECRISRGAASRCSGFLSRTARKRMN